MYIKFDNISIGDPVRMQSWRNEEPLGMQARFELVPNEAQPNNSYSAFIGHLSSLLSAGVVDFSMKPKILTP